MVFYPEPDLVWAYQKIHERDWHYNDESEADKASEIWHGNLFLHKVMIKLNSSSHHVKHL